jgi:hypothetical protein
VLDGIRKGFAGRCLDRLLLGDIQIVSCRRTSQPGSQSRALFSKWLKHVSRDLKHCRPCRGHIGVDRRDLGDSELSKKSFDRWRAASQDHAPPVVSKPPESTNNHRHIGWDDGYNFADIDDEIPASPGDCIVKAAPECRDAGFVKITAGPEDSALARRIDLEPDGSWL